MLTRRSLLAAGLAASGAAGQSPPPRVAGAASVAGLPDPAETIDLWPDGAPGAPHLLPVETVVERSTDRQLTDRAVYGISRPRLVVFRPERPNGAGLLVMPGGGYRWVVIDKEGYEIGRHLSARGFTVFVLFYRLPGEGWSAGADVALADAQRAMRLIRHGAGDLGLDPARIAAMGFSAGGHVCADLATRFASRVYQPVDAADSISARPRLAAPIYPVISMTPPLAHAGSRRLLLGDNATPAREAAHSPDRNVPPDAPPVFLVHAEDDESVPVGNSLLLHAALRARGVPVEMHLFTHGGHGFGLRRAIGKPAASWPDLFLAWAHSQGLH